MGSSRAMGEDDGIPEGGPRLEPVVERFWTFGPPYIPRTVSELLGTVNAAPFLGKPPRTVRFDGYLVEARGSCYLFSVPRRPGRATRRPSSAPSPSSREAPASGSTPPA